MKLNVAMFLAMLFLLMVVIGEVQASSRVLIQYFYYGPSVCAECPNPEAERVTQVLQEIMSEYGEQVYVMMVDIGTRQGRDIWRSLNLTKAQVMLITYNNEQVVLEEITKENLEEVIDAFLGGKPPPSEPSHVSAYNVFTAFSLGIVSGFSPCLLAMLAFILTYTTGGLGRAELKTGMINASVFGMGLFAAYMALGFLSLMLSIPVANFPTYSPYVTYLISAIIIFVGLNLMGVFKLSFNTKPFVQRLMKKYGFSLAGLFVLGVLFSLVEVFCCASALLVLLTNVFMGGTFQDLFLLIVFIVGILIPFLVVGAIGGGTAHLARKIRKRYKTLIRAVSGAILIAYGIWLVLGLVIG